MTILDLRTHALTQAAAAEQIAANWHDWSGDDAMQFSAAERAEAAAKAAATAADWRRMAAAMNRIARRYDLERAAAEFAAFHRGEV